MDLDPDVARVRRPGSSAVITYSSAVSWTSIGGIQPERTRREPVEPLLDGQQIADGIPARKRHTR